MSMPDYIPLDKCVDGNLYRIRARNGTYGVFNKEGSSFTLAREKFENIYLFDEYHFDIGAPFGTVRPLEDMGAAIDQLEFVDSKYLNTFKVAVLRLV